MAAISVVAIVAALWYVNASRPHREEVVVPAGTIYYTGPMKGRGDTYGNEDGSLASTPPEELRIKAEAKAKAKAANKEKVTN